jgi:hypothetical protein
MLELSGSKASIGRAVNIGTGIETRVIDLAHLVLDKVDTTSTIVHGDPRPGDLPRLIADTHLASTISAYAPAVELSVGLDLTIASFQRGDIAQMLENEVEESWR